MSQLDTARSFGRAVTLLLIATALIVFHLLPGALALDGMAYALWFDVGWIATPIIAGLACLRSASLSQGRARGAWRRFGLGCLVWAAGTMVIAAYGLVGAEAPFPGLADLAYLFTCLFFMGGMFQYSLDGSAAGRVQISNFLLAICSVFSVGFVLYFPDLMRSGLGPLASFIAFAYPALWLATLVFGVICFSLYVPRQRGFHLLLILASVAAQTVANYLHGFTPIRVGHAASHVAETLWVGAFVLITWAALNKTRSGELQEQANSPAARPGRTAEALVPALSTGAILLAALFAERTILGPYLLFLLPAVALFTIFLAVRENSVMASERRLRAASEKVSQDLAHSRRQLSEVLSSTGDCVLLVDREWRITYANRRAIRSASDPRQVELGISLWELFPELVGTEAENKYRQAMELQLPWLSEQFLPPYEGWFEMNAYPTPEGLSIFFRDITDRRRAHAELTRLARHDPLTNAANRTLFAERLAAGLDGGRRRSELALISIDLDGFKAVNDRMGHLAGDALLQQFAGRLAGLAREGDLVARLGGDEFAILQTGPSASQHAATVARRIVEVLRTPFSINGCEVTLGASIGIAVAPQHGTQPDELVRNADVALYRAKGEKPGGFCIFDSGTDAEIHSRQALKLDLRNALANGELELAYQPIINLATGRVSSFEALLRWRHPVRGAVSPTEFIPLAEENGLIIPIGDWSLRQACTDARNWAEDISLAVNLSAVQLGDGDFVETVRGILQETGLDPARLELEVTESVLLYDNGDYLKTLHRLRELGARIALDDFGTGYSSFGCLRSFRFDRIKIDRSFVSDLPGSQTAATIVRTVARLGGSLGMAMTAEGIETCEQLELLRAEGCGEAQGFLFSRPVFASEIGELLERGSLLGEMSKVAA